MSRELISHKVNGLNESLLVNALDGPGPGGASHEYQIRRWVTNTGDQHDDEELCRIRFQYLPIAQVGVNGVSHEALLAIVEDRLQAFQAGDYACPENAIALTKIQEAMMWLHKRTRGRIARGVEGTEEV